MSQSNLPEQAEARNHPGLEKRSLAALTDGLALGAWPPGVAKGIDGRLFEQYWQRLQYERSIWGWPLAIGAGSAVLWLLGQTRSALGSMGAFGALAVWDFSRNYGRCAPRALLQSVSALLREIEPSLINVRLEVRRKRRLAAVIYDYLVSLPLSGSTMRTLLCYRPADSEMQSLSVRYEGQARVYYHPQNGTPIAIEVENVFLFPKSNLTAEDLALYADGALIEKPVTAAQVYETWFQKAYGGK